MSMDVIKNSLGMFLDSYQGRFALKHSRPRIH